jgi:hypothetical protein
MSEVAGYASDLMSRKAIGRLPLEWKQLSGVLRGKFGARDFGSVCKNRVAFVGEVVGGGKHYFVRNYTNVLEAFAIGHDEILHRD